jgi:repressor of nif and glnA expression
MKMASFERAQKIFNNWDKEAFRAAHHEDYMFIREFEMVTLEDHVESVDEVMRNGYDVHKRWTLMHENEYVEEVRWEEGDEIVTHVSLKKDGLLWRGFVNRVKKPDPT